MDEPNIPPTDDNRAAADDLFGEAGGGFATPTTRTEARPIDIKYLAPKRVFITILGGVFLAEIIAMIIIYWIPPQPYWVETLLDALIMIIIAYPLIYRFSFRDLIKHIAEHKRSEAVLNNLLESLPVGVWITDRDGRLVHGNQATRQIWAGVRYAVVDHYGEIKGWWMESGERIEPEEWAAARAVSREETSLNEEIEIECFDGTHKIILNSAKPIYDVDRTLVGAVVVNEDISERKRYEQKLVQTNELLERYFSIIDTLIAYMDRDFNFIRVNEGYALTGGHPMEYFIGKNHFDLYPHAENQAIFQKVVDTGEPFFVAAKPFEYPEFPERGPSYWNWSLQPVKRADSVVEGLVLSLVDVTERKRAEDRLEQQNDELRAMSQAEHKQRVLAEGLVKASIALNSSLDLKRVLDRIFESIQRALPFKSANIMLVEGEYGTIAHQWGFEDVITAYPELSENFRLVSLPLLMSMTHSQQPTMVADVLAEPAWIAVPEIDWIRSYLAAPLIAGNHVIGFINLYSDQTGYFDQEMSDRLMAFAAPAAVAVRNARLYAAELDARQLAEIFSRASLALTQTLDLETIMKTFLEYVSRLVPYDCSSILFSEAEKRLALYAINSCDPDADPAQGLHTTLDLWDLPHAQTVISTCESLLIADTQAYPGWTSLLDGGRIRNWLGVPMIVGGKVIGILTLAKLKPNFFNPDHIRLAEAIVAQLSVVIQNAWLFEQVSAGHERLQSLSRRLVEVQESERRYIARELHDETSQALTSLIFGLRLLEQEVDHPENIPPRVAELKRVIDEVLENLHRLAMDLRPAALDHLGLAPAIEQLVKDCNEQTGLNARLKILGFSGRRRLSTHVETAVYRIIQEALNNTIRHAVARNADVIVELLEEKVMVLIEDDGIGFDADEIQKSGHLGLLGIQERAEMLGGSFQIESRIGGGTTVVVEVPNAN
jgi:PAS domain S-box-containing protein